MTHRRKPKEQTGPLAENLYPDGRRGLQLSVTEKQIIERRKKAQHAAVLFLDMHSPKKRSYKSIAEELGISVHALKDLTNTPEFEEAWNNLYVDIQDHPYYKAAKAKFVDMIPQALQTIEAAMNSGGWNSRLKAAQIVLSLSDIKNASKDQADKEDAKLFLQQNNIIVGEVPAEYRDDTVVNGTFIEPPPQITPPALAEDELGTTLQDILAMGVEAANAEGAS